MINKKTLGVYVHIPFCQSKCPYCDFYSIVAENSLHEEYIKAVLDTIESYQSEWQKDEILVDTVYFGGGTPSIISPKLIASVIQKLTPFITNNCEITMEANPATVDKQKLTELYKSGINRLSFGMQSADDRERTILGRKHSNEQVRQAVFTAKEVGFTNISVDMMLATPKQSLSSIDTTLDFVESLDIQHVSAYMLKIEPDTAFNREEIIADLPDEDITSDIYLKVCEKLMQSGFNQYEISNFAKQGCESKHNLKYWQLLPYIGIGPAAHSYYKGERFFYPRDIKAFIESSGKNKVLDTDDYTSKKDEYIMLSLRLSSGIELRNFGAYGIDEQSFIKKASKYIQYGFMQRQGDTFSLTPKGFLLSNTIIIDFQDG